MKMLKNLVNFVIAPEMPGNIMWNLTREHHVDTSNCFNSLITNKMETSDNLAFGITK